MTEAAPNHPAGWRVLAVGHALLGRRAEAEAAARGLLRVIPHYTVELARTSNSGIQDRDPGRLLEGLRIAGVPEK